MRSSMSSSSKFPTMGMVLRMPQPKIIPDFSHILNAIGVNTERAKQNISKWDLGFQAASFQLLAS